MTRTPIPPINSSGVFSFKRPFDHLTDSQTRLTVVAIRTIAEILADDPLRHIYNPVGLTKDDMDTDANNNIPIISFLNMSKEYIYVPASYIQNSPMTNGYIYKEKMLSIPLGMVPSELDLSVLTDIIEEATYDVLGVKSKVTETITSRSTLFTDLENKKAIALRKNKSTVNKSYRTRYYGVLEDLKKITEKKDALERYIIKKMNK